MYPIPRPGSTSVYASTRPEKDIHEYWRYVIKNSRDTEQLWQYTVCDFESAFKYYAAEHLANGYHGHPMKWLLTKVKERFPERKADAY